MRQVPHERSLVERMQGRPFAFLGVNLDRSAGDLTRAVNTHQINWRSWYDGPSGPISRQWGVRAIPSTFVIDAKGIIRYANVHGAQLDAAVEKLLQETAG
jgi:hypothetical protein